MSRTGGGHCDNDKKFINDLETAQALSLESHALEQFRLEKEKRQAETRHIFENDASGSTFPRIRPPPQAMQRRNSVTTNSNYFSSSSGSDLISFMAPNNTFAKDNSLMSYRTQPSTLPLDRSEFKVPLAPSKKDLKDGFNRTYYAAANLTVALPQLEEDHLLSTKPSVSVPLANPTGTTTRPNGTIRIHSNLIDLNEPSTGPKSKESIRVSLLEAFDPLMIRSEETYDASPDRDGDSQSIYDPYDPFDYFYYPPSQSSHNSDLVYSAVTKVVDTVDSVPPPLPPRATPPTYDPEVKKVDSVPLRQKVAPVVSLLDAITDPDLKEFFTTVKQLRAFFKYDDMATNTGLFMSPTIENYITGTSIKVVVYPFECGDPITFTSDFSASIEHVIFHTASALDIPDPNNYILKVWGMDEYLDSKACLKDYEYVHQCFKLEKDILFSLICCNQLNRIARTSEDDVACESITVEQILPNDFTNPLSYDSIVIVLETFESEIEKVLQNHQEAVTNKTDYCDLKYESVHQAVKAVCSLLGNIKTVQINRALEDLKRACLLSKGGDRGQPEILEDDGDYSVVTFGGPVSLPYQCVALRIAVHALLEVYIRSYRVAFKVASLSSRSCSWSVLDVFDNLMVYVDTIHRLQQKWNYSQYVVTAQIYYGTRPIGQPAVSKPITSSNDNLHHKHAVVDSWLQFPTMSISNLSRECRIVFEVHGRFTGDDGQIKFDELGWTAVQLFDFNRCLIQGGHLLSLWPPETNKKLGPAPPYCVFSLNGMLPVMGISLPDFGGDIVFPSIQPDLSMSWDSYDFESLDENTQHQLLEIMDQDTFSNPVVEDREILWEKRHYLLKQPKALPKVLLAAHSWDQTCLSDLYSLLHSWTPMDSVNAFQLLLPCFPDCEVRKLAVKWIDKLKTDRLIDYLPQLVQALKHETYETSPLVELLLRRSLTSLRFAHSLYWLLIQTLPGQAPQNSSSNFSEGEISVSDARYYNRMQLLLRTLLAISGESLSSIFMSQLMLMKELSDAAEMVKLMRESSRLRQLWNSLESVNSNLSSSPTCLPTNPSLVINGLNIQSCSYFPSNTLPLKLNFSSEMGLNPSAIFKIGDDLQQDMISMQMIRLMDKIWLKEGLDLKIVTFTCIPTGYRRGIIEMIPDSETLRKIQVEFGLTGSFKDRPIAEWLAKHNPSALDYERAVSNFTASCAGYCVATYILGICDRHNDNIMIKTTGHIFHIDFGKFLGDAQMIGNFKRDRTPFVLTSDMAYVINGGEKPSVKFHHFVDLCCQAFNIIRENGNVILNLFGLMASSGVGGLNVESVRYVQNALLPHLSNAEAAATFARMIQSSLKSWFTQFNFFIHNLAQLRFSIDQDNGQLLSFVSRTYSMQQEGRITQAEVYGCQKRYDPEKYYIYILRIRRANHPDPMFLFRSYKEFCEFHQKLCLLFPLAKCHSLHSSTIKVGRSNIKQVAEKRKLDLQRFLDSLFAMADEICHSNLVYTFFHPILRDQQDSSVNELKLKDKKKDKSSSPPCNIIKGEIKLTLHYRRETFRVMIHHVRDLPCITGYQEPSTYVKVYLLPDHSKVTKRKTKVIKKNCHPSFMEMLEYRLPIEKIQNRLLQATVWSHDSLQENEFLGGTTINLCEMDLKNEITDWYPLKNIHR